MKFTVITRYTAKKKFANFRERLANIRKNITSRSEQDICDRVHHRTEAHCLYAHGFVDCPAPLAVATTRDLLRACKLASLSKLAHEGMLVMFNQPVSLGGGPLREKHCSLLVISTYGCTCSIKGGCREC